MATQSGMTYWKEWRKHNFYKIMSKTSSKKLLKQLEDNENKATLSTPNYKTYLTKLTVLKNNLSEQELQTIKRAFDLCVHAHRSQKRKSGEPYSTHPTAVSLIVAKMGFDVPSICGALMHDVVEDTTTTLSDIEWQFGKEIAAIVDGVTKLNKLEFSNISSYKAENLRKFILTLSNDLRIVIVKLADRLHNMQTLHYVSDPQKRKNVAIETMEIYAPISRMIGITGIQRELEDLAFKEIMPEIRESILARMEYLTTKNSEAMISRIIDILKELMISNGIKCKIQSRVKTPFSIWQKMQNKEIAFEQLSDVMAFRIITDNINNCYKTLGTIHTNFSVLFDKFKDYISIPKRNNYRSLHTTVIGPENKKIEVQIRTEQMHLEAEFGIAAHSFYKDGKIMPRDGLKGDLVFLNWIKGITEAIQNSNYSEDIFNYVKLEMHIHDIFSFTPVGDIIRLPQNATVLDFAFAIHTDIGFKTKSAKINGIERSLDTIVQNGDQIEIIRASKNQVKEEWMQIVATGRAKSAIKRALKFEARKDYIHYGRTIFKQTCETYHIIPTDSFVKNIIYHCGLKDIEDLYYQIGNNQLNARIAIFSKIKTGESQRVLEIKVPKINYNLSAIIKSYETESATIQSLKIINESKDFIKLQIAFSTNP